MLEPLLEQQQFLLNPQIHHFRIAGFDLRSFPPNHFAAVRQLAVSTSVISRGAPDGVW